MAGQIDEIRDGSQGDSSPTGGVRHGSRQNLD